VRSDFGNRPLRDTRLDRSRFIDRPDDRAAIERALDLGYNVALVAEPGAGVTTLLEHIAAHRPAARRINVEGAQSAGEVLWAAARALGSEGGTPEQEIFPRAGLHELTRAVAALVDEPEPELLVDALDPVVAHDLFGRMRDELWDVPVHWVLALRTDDEPVALMAPANAFFEATVRLGAFTEVEMIALLKARDGERLLSGEQVQRIAAVATTPAAALALARGVVLHGPAALDELDPDRYEHVAEQLGDSAARVLRELDHSGPSGPSDDALLARVRLSRPRAYEVFRELEGAGYVVRSHQPTGRQGRPPAIFSSRDAG
jgi:hypothetical protein